MRRILLITISLSSSLFGKDQESILPVFRESCVRCHGENGKVKGKLNLLEIASVAELKKDPERLQKIIEAIDFQEMPPEDEPQLKAGVRTQLLADLEMLRHESVSGTKAYAATPIRRMNRFQYNNAVTDLFDLNCVVFTLPERMLREHKDYFQPQTRRMPSTVYVGSRPLGKSQLIEDRLDGVAAFPQDLRAEHGFDNQADHLSLSPLLMEAFLTLGQSITQSPDFTAKSVGIWKTFFEVPSKNQDTKSEVRLRLEPFLNKAFRKPVEAKLLDRYTGHVLRQLDAGVVFEDAMKSIAAAAIASPRFLYLYDKSASSEAAETIDDFELASRLSFFLWGSLPDETLLGLAAKGELHKTAVLEAQFERMMKDRKLKRFCDSFPSQWLQLERIISSIPDKDKFPDFYFSKYRASMHMMLEPLLLFEAILIENKPVTQLVDSDFTYRSLLLERNYEELALGKLPNNANVNEVTRLEFKRTPVTDRRSGGVITNAAVMTMTSGPDRTKPITRGAWIASVIFNNPPKPPPADVPPLNEKPAAGEENLTLRERLSMHRERADCRGCHEQIDPLGFALENYDPVGRWRTQYENDRDVDMQGTLFRKHPFNSVIDFKDAILAEKDRFTRALAGHLLTFALARELGPADQIALDHIAQATAKDSYKFQTLIKQVVLSEPFQTKTTPKLAEASGAAKR
ncbi:DUF1592 domain-containing protein [Prosthecobacter sp.]|uniref:DUF1592 domain-containing protein n=1 Tax=Prosthecobacter sp. TaxID=1965333 RepID=UPI001D3D71DD|nr:DUF1592 domain-containing protein [Prosthecobacter sp.]MCB1278742.1 DUF1592 domain-containing protein [Prosthecobacter sp.]